MYEGSSILFSPWTVCAILEVIFAHRVWVCVSDLVNIQFCMAM